MQSTALTMIDYSLIDDATLARKALHDSEAFSALYRRYVTPLYRYIHQRVGNTKDAEDRTAQVFTDVLEGLPHYRERFSAWLFTIAHRRLVDHYRQRSADLPDEMADNSPALQTSIEENETHATERQSQPSVGYGEASGNLHLAFH